jgi:AAA15 family ATPase/GTPase
MLVEFSASNFRSIRERQTLSMVAASGAELRATHVFDPSAPATPELVRSAVLYGPNAAGKSNLILALEFMRDFVLNSAQKKQKGDEIPVTPFAMDGSAANQPSEFEVVFVEDGVRYQYGFSVTRERVEREWLTVYPKGRPQSWFDRKADSDDWAFGPGFRGQRKVWQEATRSNALFFSTAIQLNAEQLAPIYNWFRRRLRMINPYAHINPGFSISQCEHDTPLRHQIVEFLAKADLGINGVKVERRKFDVSMLPEGMPEAVRQRVLLDMEGKELAGVRLTHRGGDGKKVILDLEEESGGTQKAFALAGPWLDVLVNGLVLVIDELDTSLHPLLMRQLVGLFNDPGINRHNAQLMFSTHDTSILDGAMFRRDQIWFVEKDGSQQTHLYPLTDFSPRKSENFERGYLQGRYGALPFIGELRV